MKDASNILINKDDLRILIDESIKQGMSDIPTTSEVERMIDNRLSAEIDRWGTEVDSKIEKAIERTYTATLDELRKITSQLAVIAEQTKHMREVVEDVKSDQQNTKKKLDELDDDVQSVKETQINQAAKLDSQEHAIFGDATRPGTKSLFDHITDTDQKRAEKTQIVLDKLDRKMDAANTRNQVIEAKVDTIQAEVEKNTTFREARQKMEQLAVKYVGGAFKGVGSLTKNKLFWAVVLSGGGIGSLISFLMWLLENTQ
jgi:chromosome segregation ATPase